MFTVISKNNSKIVRDVYDIRTNLICNVLEFLIYADCQWMWVPANEYIPYEPKMLYHTTHNPYWTTDRFREAYEIFTKMTLEPIQNAGYPIHETITLKED